MEQISTTIGDGVRSSASSQTTPRFSPTEFAESEAKDDVDALFGFNWAAIRKDAKKEESRSDSSSADDSDASDSGAKKAGWGNAAKRSSAGKKHAKTAAHADPSGGFPGKTPTLPTNGRSGSPDSSSRVSETQSSAFSGGGFGEAGRTSGTSSASRFVSVVNRGGGDDLVESSLNAKRFTSGSSSNGVPGMMGAAHQAATESSSSNMSSASRNRTNAARDRQCFVIDPIVIKPSSVDYVLNRMSADELLTASVKPKKPPSQSLPQQLDMPLALRCDFCRKFDSVCSTCHRKWKGILDKRAQEVALRNYSRLQEERKISILFMSAAHGTGPFVSMQVGHDKEKSFKWRSRFYPLDSADGELQATIGAAGEVFPLHVAMACDNIPAAQALLEVPRAIISKSEKRVDPLEFLGHPISPQWEEGMSKNMTFKEHWLSERAKKVRAEGKWEEAERLYAEILAFKPDSEHAWTGKAKMAHDRGEFEKAMQLCSKIMSEEITVDWNEIEPDAVKRLSILCTDAYHKKNHEDPKVLKPCGCVITDKVRLSIRKLPMAFIVDNIFPYCDGESLYGVYSCSRMPLLRSAAEKSTVLLPAKSITNLLTKLPGYREIHKQVFARMPPMEGLKAMIRSDARPLGIFVTAMADFSMFLVKGSVIGSNPREVSSVGSTVGNAMSFFGFGKKNEDKSNARGGENGGAALICDKPIYVLSKQYRVYRQTPDEPWRVRETSEWELDRDATEELEVFAANSKQRQ